MGRQFPNVLLLRVSRHVCRTVDLTRLLTIESAVVVLVTRYSVFALSIHTHNRLSQFVAIALFIRVTLQNHKCMVDNSVSDKKPALPEMKKERGGWRGRGDREGERGDRRGKGERGREKAREKEHSLSQQKSGKPDTSSE